MAKIRLRAKQLTCLFLMLTSVLLGFSFLPRAKAAMQVFSVNPTTGNVGANVTVVANLTTPNGAYNVNFNGVVQAVGTASGNNVNASFLVPEAAAGNYNITVVDVNASETATFVNFTVSTAYYLNSTVPPTPIQYQEGDSVPISFNVTGDVANTAVDTYIEVVNPDSSPYFAPVGFNTTALGSGAVTVSYPGDFNASANTKFVGIYTVSTYNVSAVGPTAFKVGLTNSTEYHRMQTVNVRATGYTATANETVMLNVTGTNVQYSVNLTALPGGLINFSGFAVPTNATVGSYTVSIVSTAEAFPTVKSPPDTQIFAVPGFAFNVTAVNLAGEAVPSVRVEAFENGTSVSNQTTDSNGLAVSMLEIGNYTLKGYFQSVDVGEGSFEVNNTETSNLALNLTDLGVKVVAIVNGNEVGIPEAGVNLAPVFVTLTTDINGDAEVKSLLPNTTYTLSASRYNTLFNGTNIIQSSSNSAMSNGTLTNLLVGGSPVAVFNVTIACPSFALQIRAFEAGGQPFSNATVKANEAAGGIGYEGSTDSSGAVVFQNATFGQYDVGIFDSAGTELNSTTVNLFQNQNVTVNCDLFGLSISVTVTDYFGQPFANTEVTLQGNGVGPISSRTQANGTVTFANLVGKSYNVSVYLSTNGPPNTIANLFVNGSTTVSIKMNGYVLLAGVPVVTAQLAVVLIIVLTVLLVLVLEVYRRRRGKGQKQTVESE